MKYWKQEDMGRIKMSSYSDYVEQRAVEDHIRKAIAKKLLKGRTPEWIHEEDEYPMELIMYVKAMLEGEQAQEELADLGEESMPIQEKLERMDFLSYGDEREEKGEKKGEKRGEDKFARLVSKLIQAGRYAELEKAANDRQYRAELLETSGENPREVDREV